jgi:hypothetical protein
MAASTKDDNIDGSCALDARFSSLAWLAIRISFGLRLALS